MTAIPAAEATGTVEPADAPAAATTTRRTRWFWAGLAAVALAALGIRVVYVLGWQHPTSVIGDAFYYHHGANLLADGRGFPHPYRLLQDGVDTPGAQHPPLYIVALAAGSLVGLRSFLDHQLLSCVFGTLTVVLIGLTGRRIAGPAVGLVAAGIAAVYPNMWLNDGLVLSETLVQTVSAGVVLAAYVYWRRRSVASVAVLGVVVGLAALTRAELILLTVALIAPLCLLARSVPWRRRIGLLAVAAGAFVVVVGPWCAYNLARYQEPVYVSSGLPPTLVVSNCDDTFYGPDRGYWSYTCLTKLPPVPGDESQQGVVYSRIAKDYISTHKGALPRVVAERIGRTFGLYQPLRQVRLDIIEKRPLPASQVGLGVYYLLAVLSVGGAVLLRRRGIPLLPLLAPIGVVVFAVAVTFGQTRYRASAEVSFVLLAAVLLVAAAGRLRRQTPEGAGSATGGTGSPNAAAKAAPMA